MRLPFNIGMLISLKHSVQGMSKKYHKRELYTNTTTDKLKKKTASVELNMRTDHIIFSDFRVVHSLLLYRLTRIVTSPFSNILLSPFFHPDKQGEDSPSLTQKQIVSELVCKVYSVINR